MVLGGLGGLLWWRKGVRSDDDTAGMFWLEQSHKLLILRPSLLSLVGIQRIQACLWEQEHNCQLFLTPNRAIRCQVEN